MIGGEHKKVKDAPAMGKPGWSGRQLRWVLGGVRKSRAGAQTVGDRWKPPGNGHGLVVQAVHWDSKSVSMGELGQ